MSRDPRLLRRAAAAALGAVLLAGCAPEPVPTFTPPAVPEFAPPSVSESRAQDILDQVGDVIEVADASANADELAPRVVAPASDIRRAQYQLQSATGGTEVPQKLWTDSDITVITATDSWPREILAVTNPTEGTTARLYLGLVQQSPRDQYKLVAWSRLLPGVTTPTFASADIGSAPVTADQTGLLMTPTDAVAHLADTIANPQGQYAGEFPADPYRTFFADEIARLTSDVAAAGSVTTTSTPGSVVLGIGTADGGALVMASVDTVVTFRKTVEGSTLTLGSLYAALGGTEEVTAAANATYSQMVTLYIPPAGSSAQMQLLGADRVLSKVERVD